MHEQKKTLSIIIPCFNEQESIYQLFNEIIKLSQNSALQEVIIKLIFVNDGSSDNTLFIIKELAAKQTNVHYISFSRNFGKEASIYAGLEYATGDYIALMDADLQDPPQLLEQMYLAIKNDGYDCVAARRISRKGEPWLRSIFAKNFYRLMNLISKTKIIEGARDFRLMTKQMATAIISLQEYNRFSKGLFNWVGFKTKWLTYENVERRAGQSKWSFWSLFLYSIEGIIAFSTVPLAITSVCGFFISFVSLLYIIVIIIKTLLLSDPVSGWPSLASIICFMGGLQILFLGIIGQYQAKIYLETKKRPIYIIKEINNNG